MHVVLEVSYYEYMLSIPLSLIFQQFRSSTNLAFTGIDLANNTDKANARKLSVKNPTTYTPSVVYVAPQNATSEPAQINIVSSRNVLPAASEQKLNKNPLKILASLSLSTISLWSASVLDLQIRLATPEINSKQKQNQSHCFGRARRRYIWKTLRIPLVLHLLLGSVWLCPLC